MTRYSIELAQMRGALEPFAALSPSSLYSDDENEGYEIVLVDGRKPDITRQNILRARAALAAGQGEA